MNNELVLHPNGSNIIYITCFYQLIPFSFAIYYCVYCSSLITGIFKIVTP